jgi:PKD repeat protein
MLKKGGKVFLILIFLSLGFFVGQKCLAVSAGDVVINEIAWMGSADNANAEWMELRNLSGTEIDLSGWTLNAADGTPKINLSGNISAGGYFLLERTSDSSAPGATADLIYSGALTNGGEILELKNGEGNLIDKIDASSGWPAGDNVAKQTMERKNDGSWQNSIASGGTPKAENDEASGNSAPTASDNNNSSKETSSNIISTPENSTRAAEPSSAKPKGDVYITEILPNPSGADGEGEFIELHNYSDKEIDLAGWRIEVEGGRSFEFGKFLNLKKVLSAQEYFALFRRDSNLILDNNGGTIRLFKPDKTRPEQILQYGPAPEGLSFCDTTAINLVNTNASTKKFLANSLSVGQWVWNTAYTPGAPNQIKTLNHSPVPNFSLSVKIIAGEPVDFDASDSFDEDGDALSYQWDFGDGVQLNSETPEHIFLRPGNYQVKLTASDGQESVVIKKTINVGGVSLFDDSAAPEEIVVNEAPIVLPAVGTQYLAFQSAPPNSAGAVAGVKIYSATAAPQKSATVSLAKYKLGTGLKISGTVIVLPGIFGVQYFYIIEDSPLGRGVDAPGGDGEGLVIKIYNYYKDFPKLALGDVIEVTGVVSGSATDKYLKTKTAADIKILGKAEAPAPKKITVAGFKEENLDKFVQIEGEVQEKNGSQISLANGTGTISVYLKSNTGISAASFKAGEKITITGLLSKVSGKLAILPRGQFDIAAASSSAGTPDIAFLQSTGSPDWTLPARENNRQGIFYFLLVIAFFLIFSAIVFWKRKK